MVQHAQKVASSTIDSHFNRIYREVKFHDARMLVVWALSNGFDGNGNYPGLSLVQ